MPCTMESGHRGRFCIHILIVGIAIFLAVINNGRVVEGITTQIDTEIAKVLVQQSLAIQKMSNDLKSIMDQMKKTESSLATPSDVLNDCCKRQEYEIKVNQQLLKKIEAMLANCTLAGTQTIESIKNATRVVYANRSEIPVAVVYGDCSEFRRKGHPSGPYYISINNKTITVYCDFDTPGGDWLVFQRRLDGSVPFRQTWDAYANGFGNVVGEFWLGNEILYQLTSNRKYKLRVDLEDFENQKRYAEYSSFSIGPSSDFYRLTIGDYSGDAGDSLRIHNHLQFSTFDSDHDTWQKGNCARMFQGAWWYGECHNSNLNGIFYRGTHRTYGDGVDWNDFHGLFYSLKSEMKIAPLN